MLTADVLVLPGSKTQVVEPRSGRNSANSFPVMPEFTSEVIRQRFFQDFFTGFLKGLLPSSTLSNKATSGLPLFFKAAS